MNEKAMARVHWSFRVIGAIALVWNAMGVLNYLMQMDPEAIAAYPETHRAIIEHRPAWATGGFAVAVFGGTLGGILLLLRRSAATAIFIASLIGVVVTMIHTLGVLGAGVGFTPFEIVLMMVLPVGVAGFLVWYARSAAGKGWIR